MPRWQHMPAGYFEQHQHHQHQAPSPGHFGSSSGSTSSFSSASSYSSSSGSTRDSALFGSPTASFRDNMSLEMLTDVQPLDQGGFCVVCSCTYRGQKAVLKVPKPQGPDSAVADLLVEIDIYRRISEQGGHRNLARAIGSGFHTVQGTPSPFLVLEMIEGGNLAQAIERSRTSSEADGGAAWSDPMPRLPVALELAEALHFLHCEAVPGGFVLHRDLKPTNIGLCASGHVKVFDLGLSVVQETRKGNVNQKYQMSGMAGSKRFMSPEVCNGLPYNEKVDVYSFAIVLWELCALRKPFKGMSVADHYREVITGGLRPPLDPRWPAGLRHLLEACWDQNPDRRPTIAEAGEFLRQLILTRGGWS